MTTVPTAALAHELANIGDTLGRRLMQHALDTSMIITDVRTFADSLSVLGRRGADNSAPDDNRLNDLIDATRLGELYKILDWTAGQLCALEGVEPEDEPRHLVDLLDENPFDLRQYAGPVT